jgi:hypothetical protein
MAVNPRHGEVWLADMGLAAKVRPVVLLLADEGSAMPAALLSFSVLLVADGPHNPYMQRDDIEWHGDWGFFRWDPNVWVYGGDSGPGIRMHWGAYSREPAKATAP